MAVFRGGGWEIGTISAGKLMIGGQQVVGARGAAVATPQGGSVVDLEARAAINAIIERLRSHGLVG